MNPDIQRIAETFAEVIFYGVDSRGIRFYGPDEKDVWCWQRRTKEQVKKTAIDLLTELSALRDTQERELRERLPADWFEDASLETWFPLTAETLKEKEKTITSLRAELARRDEVEKRLNDESNGLKEQIINQVTVIKSLRSRIGELEGKLGEKT